MRRNVRELPATAWFLIAGSSINKFGSFVVPFLVLYLRSKGFSIAQAGTAVAAYGLGEVAAGFVGGYLADRIGRRKTIVLSMFTSAAAMVALSQVETFGPVLVLAFATGLVSEARRPAVLALLTDLVRPDQHVTMFAVTRLAENVAFASGIALGGFLANHNFLWLFLGDAASSIAFGVVALTILPEGRRSQSQEEHASGGFRAVLSNGPFMIFLAATVLLAFVYFQQQATLPLHVRASGLSNADFGILLSLNGILVMLFELPLSSFTMRRPPREMIALGFLLVGLGFGLTAVAHSIVALGGTVAIWTLGEMIAAPVSYAYVAQLAPAHMQGRYQGMYGVTFSTGAIFGPALGTLIYSHATTGFWALCGGAGLAASLLVLGIRSAGLVQRTEGGEREVVVLPEPATADAITAVISEPEPVTKNQP
jgi:MFS family permease